MTYIQLKILFKSIIVQYSIIIHNTVAYTKRFVLSPVGEEKVREKTLIYKLNKNDAFLTYIFGYLFMYLLLSKKKLVIIK